MSISKLTQNITPLDVISKINEIIDSLTISVIADAEGNVSLNNSLITVSSDENGNVVVS